MDYWYHTLMLLSIYTLNLVITNIFDTVSSTFYISLIVLYMIKKSMNHN